MNTAIPEFGSVQDADQFRALYAYSPGRPVGDVIGQATDVYAFLFDRRGVAYHPR